MRFNPSVIQNIVEKSVIVLLFLVINNASNPFWVYSTFALSFLIVGFQLFQAIYYRYGKRNFYLLPSSSDSFNRFITFFTGGFMFLASIISLFLPIKFVHTYAPFFILLSFLILLNGVFKKAYKKFQFYDQKIFIDDVMKEIEINQLDKLIIRSHELVFTNKNQQKLIIKKLEFHMAEKEKFYAYLKQHNLMKDVTIQLD